MRAPIMRQWNSPSVVTTAPAFDFILAAAKGNHKAAIIGKLHVAGRRPKAVIVPPTQAGLTGIGYVAVYGKPLFVVKAVEHCLAFVHLIGTAAYVDFAEVPAFAVFLEFDVNGLRTLAVIHTGECRLIAHLFVQLHLIYHVTPHVAGDQGGVVTEKLLPIDQYPIHSLTLCRDLAILVNGDAWQLLKQILDLIVRLDHECAWVKFRCIAFDGNGLYAPHEDLLDDRSTQAQLDRSKLDRRIRIFHRKMTSIVCVLRIGGQ